MLSVILAKGERLSRSFTRRRENVKKSEKLSQSLRRLAKIFPVDPGSFFGRSRQEKGLAAPDPSSSLSSPTRFPVRRFLLLAAIGGGVFLVGILNGFPHREMARYYLRELSETGGVGLNARMARFDLPGSLGYSDLSLVTPSPEGPLKWTIDDASGHLEVASLVSRKPRFNFKIHAYGENSRDSCAIFQEPGTTFGDQPCTLSTLEKPGRSSTRTFQARWI